MSDSEEYVDQKLLEEERQLEAEREREEREAEEKEAASRPAVQRPADGMDQLTQLLLKTNAYTDFLYKQLTEKEKEKDNEDEGEGDEVGLYRCACISYAKLGRCKQFYARRKCWRSI